MACFTAIVFILLGFINLSAENKDTCDIYAAVGQNPTLQFVYEKLTNSHVVRWTRDDTIVFYRQQGRVSVGKPDDISKTGSLLLRNVQLSSAGTYKANVLNPNGTLAKSWIGRLCILNKVPKPEVRYSCDFKSNAVNLECIVGNTQDVVFSWTLDKKSLPSETRQKLSISLNQLKGERSFTCSAANKVSRETSNTVHPTCKSPPPPPQLCFASKIVVAVLAGGGALILLLVIAVIVLCWCNKRKQNQLRLQDKGELRMLSLNKREPESVCHEYETMHQAENCPPPSPQPSPRACYHNVSQPEVETENRLPPPAAEGQEPSPVPKPRTKNLQTSNI